MVDDEDGELIGVQAKRASELADDDPPLPQARMPGQNHENTTPTPGGQHLADTEVRFSYEQPSRGGGERHYFKTIQDGYAEQLRQKRLSLTELVDENPGDPEQQTVDPALPDE